MQQMMLRWEEFCPMNALHAIAFSADVKFLSVCDAVAAALKSLQIGPVEISSNQTRIRWLRQGETRDQLLVPRKQVCQDWNDLYKFFSLELNDPFPDGIHWPFRLVFIERLGATSMLSLTYRHAVSDSRGASLILREILRQLRHNGVEESDGKGVSALHQVALPLRSDRHLAERVYHTIEEALNGSRQFLGRHRFATGAPIRCLVPHVTIPLGLVRRSAKELGVRIHLLFLAAIFEGLSILLQDEVSGRSWRKFISIQTPVDLRPLLNDEFRHAQGQYLGSSVSRMKVKPGNGFRDYVLRVIQNAYTPNDRNASAESISRLETMARAWDCCLPRSIKGSISTSFYSAMAVATNVNLNQFLEVELAAGQIQSYLRFTGTGILIPLMFGLTTLGERVSLTTTCHDGSFTSEEQQCLLRHIAYRLSGNWERVDTLYVPAQLESVYSQFETPS
jgi:hypothetical protein